MRHSQGKIKFDSIFGFSMPAASICDQVRATGDLRSAWSQKIDGSAKLATGDSY
jgi:hypothetical protein